MNVDILKVITGTKNAIDLVNKIIDLMTRSATLDLQQNIVTLRDNLINLQESLLQIKIEKVNLQEKIFRLEKENEKLKSRRLELNNGGYYKEDGDGPFCKSCYEHNEKLVRLNRIGIGSHNCPACQESLISKY